MDTLPECVCCRHHDIASRIPVDETGDLQFACVTEWPGLLELFQPQTLILAWNSYCVYHGRITFKSII